MMHSDPSPTISVGIIVEVGAAYDTHHHWWTNAGESRASVGFEAGGYSRGHIQGAPAALRELAAALLLATDQADQAEAGRTDDAIRPAAEAVGS